MGRMATSRIKMLKISCIILILLVLTRQEGFKPPTAWFVAIYSHFNCLFVLDIVQSARCHFIST